MARVYEPHEEIPWVFGHVDLVRRRVEVMLECLGDELRVDVVALLRHGYCPAMLSRVLRAWEKTENVVLAVGRREALLGRYAISSSSGVKIENLPTSQL